MLDLSKQKILLTGGHGFLGSKVYIQLLEAGALNKNIFRPHSKELDLRVRKHAAKAVRGRDMVIHLAASVGGIGYRQAHPGTLFYDNAIMGLELIEQSRLAGVKKFVQVGTVAGYPQKTPIPFKEKNLWSGYPEEANAPYGLAKKMMLVMLQAYRQQYGFNGIYLLVASLYGPGDNFDSASSQVLPALVRRFVEAKKQKKSKVTIWGANRARREFLYVDDAARAIVLAAQKYSKKDPVNIGSGKEIKLKELAGLIAKYTGFTGTIIWDKTKPEGQMRMKLDVSRAKREFGFKASIDFKTGLKKTIGWYIKNRGKI